MLPFRTPGDNDFNKAESTLPEDACTHKDTAILAYLCLKSIWKNCHYTFLYNKIDPHCGPTTPKVQDMKDHPGAETITCGLFLSDELYRIYNWFFCYIKLFKFKVGELKVSENLFQLPVWHVCWILVICFIKCFS